MTSTMYMSSHSVSDSAGGGPRTCEHATMACGGFGYLSWCTPHGGGVSVRKNECESRAIFARICCMFALPMALQTQGTPAVGIGHFVGHRGTVASDKGAISFRRHLDFNFFLGFFNILLPSQLYENSHFRLESYICAPMFAQFWLCVQKFPYRPFAKGTHMALACA